MSRRIIPRDQVAQKLAVSPQVLIRYESMGFIHVSSDPEASAEGYEPAQIRRLWTILSFQRDMGVNLAGVEVILRLCDQLKEVHQNLRGLASDLQGLLEADDSQQEP